MRIRSIKPEFWRSPDISCLSIEDRLLFLGLWSYVDDNGVGDDRVARIAADLFADDLAVDAPDTLARVTRGLARLSETGRITRYTVAGRDFFEVTNWKVHQRIDKPGKARLPTADAEGAVIRDTLASLPEKVAPRSGNRDQGTEDQGAGNKGTAPAVLASEFDRAWSSWPKKVEKQPAFEKFKTKCRTRVPSELADDIVRFGEAYAATTDKQFVPGLAVWLNKERWTDELPQVRQSPQQKTTAADRNAQAFHDYYGGDYERAGGIPALDSGIG